MENKLNKYIKAFQEGKLLQFCKDQVQRSSQALIYSALLLFFAYKRKDTPGWAKSIIIGGLGYLLTPIDGIPDLTPFLGLTDDMGILSFALVTIACYIDDEVRLKALMKLKSISKADIDADKIALVDKYL